MDDTQKIFEHFIMRVKYMRECQKTYFRTRQQEALQKSKALESEIDKYIQEHADKKNGVQKTLFDAAQ